MNKERLTTVRKCKFLMADSIIWLVHMMSSNVSLGTNKGRWDKTNQGEVLKGEKLQTKRCSQSIQKWNYCSLKEKALFVSSVEYWDDMQTLKVHVEAQIPFLRQSLINKQKKI